MTPGRVFTFRFTLLRGVAFTLAAFTFGRLTLSGLLVLPFVFAFAFAFLLPLALSFAFLFRGRFGLFSFPFE